MQFCESNLNSDSKTQRVKRYGWDREKGILEDIKQLLLILSSVYMDCFYVLEI